MANEYKRTLVTICIAAILAMLVMGSFSAVGTVIYFNDNDLGIKKSLPESTQTMQSIFMSKDSDPSSSTVYEQASVTNEQNLNNDNKFRSRYLTQKNAE